MALATDYIAAKVGFAQRLRDIFTDLADRLARRRVMRQTIAELQVLSDRELADLGLRRAEIRRIAYQAAQEA